MNLTTVRIRQLSAVGVVHDDADFEAPRSGVTQGAEVTLRCQVAYDTFERRAVAQGGDRDQGGGRLVFSNRYLARQGVTLQKGDRVTAVRNGSTFRTVNFRITEVAPSAHLPDPNITVAFFSYDAEDRAVP